MSGGRRSLGRLVRITILYEVEEIDAVFLNANVAIPGPDGQHQLSTRRLLESDRHRARTELIGHDNFLLAAQGEQHPLRLDAEGYGYTQVVAYDEPAGVGHCGLL